MNRNHMLWRILVLGMCTYSVSCSSTTLPICPKVAEASYGTALEGSKKKIGKRVAEELERRNIMVRPLSGYSAKFTGTKSNISWLRDNYSILFLEDSVGARGKRGSSCSLSKSRIDTWIKFLDGNQEDRIRVDSVFHDCCISPIEPKPPAVGRISTKLPLCPKLASLSYNTVEEGKGKLIGHFLATAAAKRNIEINPLSAFVAEFSGKRSDIEWLKRNYMTLVCAFNPALVIDDEGVQLSCMSHVADWIDLVQSGKERNLMLREQLYCPNCCGDAD